MASLLTIAAFLFLLVVLTVWAEQSCVVPKYGNGTYMQVTYVPKYSWNQFKMVEEPEWSPVLFPSFCGALFMGFSKYVIYVHGDFKNALEEGSQVMEPEWSPVVPESSIPHGKKIYLQCEGPLFFDPLRSSKSGEMVCERGNWKPSRTCELQSCVVPKYGNGTFMQVTYVSKYSWSQFKMVEDPEWSPVFPESSYPLGKKIHLFCKEPSTFEGVRGKKSGEMVCERGGWNPWPNCELPGTYIEMRSTTRQVYSTSQAPEQRAQKEGLTAEVVLKKTNASTSTKSAGETSVDIPVTQETTTVAEKVVVEEIQEYFCNFLVQEDNLLAFQEGKRLAYGSRVKNGRTVTLYCRHLGKQRLVGAQNITCTHCNWHPSEFPSCVDPVDGDTVMNLQTPEQMELQVSNSGTIIIPRGITLNVTCHVLGRREWAVFHSPNSARPKYVMDTEKDVLLALIDIEETGCQHSGKYWCISGHRGNYLHLTIEEGKRPYPPEFKEIIPSETSIQVKWSFPHPDTSINGVLLQWYDEPSASNSKDYFSMELLNETIIEDLNPSTEYKIFLRSLNAYGESDPISESVRTLDKASGFQGPSCPFHTIFDVLPQGVQPDVRDSEYTENVPVGGVIKLTCDSSYMRPLGQPVAICGSDEQWVAPKRVQCIVACGPIEQQSGSDVIIDPIKEMYRFGEFVTFSCRSGQKLNSSNARIMCLKGVWSSNITPVCIDV